MKGCILPFPKKGDHELAKNYRGITLTSIAAKIYNALLRNRIEPKIDNILRKKQNGFRRNRSTTSQILTIRGILEGVRAKNLQATILFVDFTKAFDSIHRGKIEQILRAYGVPKETVAAITILYRNTKVKVRSPDGDTEYFDIVAIWMHYLDANKTAGEKARRQLHKGNTEQIMEVSTKTATCLPSRKLSKTNQTCRTLLEKQKRAH